MSRLKDRFPDRKAPSRPHDRPASIPGKRIIQLKVHAPRVPSDPEDFARFVAQLNSQFGLISDKLAQPFDTTPFVLADDLDGILDERDQRLSDEFSSEGEVDGSPLGPGGSRTSRRHRQAEETAQAAVENAKPQNPPPDVQTTGAIGTTTEPRFSYEDHTHGGVRALRRNSGGGEFKRRRWNFIEGAGMTITMVDDNVDDEVDVTFVAASSTDTGFHRIFLLMGA